MNEEALHVCLLTYRGNPQSGGQGVYVRLLSSELAAMGHRVDVWSGPPYPELEPPVDLVPVPSLDLWNERALHRIPTLRELRDPINVGEWVRTRLGEFAEPRTFTQRVAREFEKRNGNAAYDIVHDNQSLGPGLLELQARAPVLATIHHPVTMDRRIALASAPNLLRRYGLWRWYSFLPMQQRVARSLDAVLTVSRASADDLERDYGIPRDRLRVVGNGINVDVFRPLVKIPRRQDRLITTLSADMPLKGFSYLIDALAAVRVVRPTVELTVVGVGEPRKPTKKQIDRLGLDRVIHFTGRVSAQRIAELYAESTVAVVASLYEGFGFPAGEAMACEVPVVSTRGGALPEVVGTDGSTGVLVETGSADALARAMLDLLDASPQRRAQMGAAGRRRVLEQFTWRHAAQRTVECYREAIAAWHRAECERREQRGGLASDTVARLAPEPALEPDISQAMRRHVDHRA